MLLNGKVIVVTGASEGLGAAITAKLVEKGAKVAMISRNRPEKEIENTKHYECDISNKEQVEKSVKSIENEFGEIHGLINSAGIWQKTRPFEESTLDEIENVISTNLIGVLYMTNRLLPHLKSREEAVLVNISSKSGTRPMELQTIYCASKYGVKGFTDTLKLELKGSSVKVMGFYPSGMNTNMFSKAGEDFPANSFMDVDEIAEIITFSIERPGNISIEEIQVEKY